MGGGLGPVGDGFKRDARPALGAGRVWDARVRLPARRLASGVERGRWGNVSRTRRGAGPLAAGLEGGFPVGLGLDFAVVENRGARGVRPGRQVQTLEDGPGGLGEETQQTVDGDSGASRLASGAP